MSRSEVVRRARPIRFSSDGIPALRRAGGGSIINTASFVALLGAATPQLAYTASKGGVLSLTRELAVIHAREKKYFYIIFGVISFYIFTH